MQPTSVIANLIGLVENVTGGGGTQPTSFMENVTGGGWIQPTSLMENVIPDRRQFIEIKISLTMFTYMPPFILALGTVGNLATILVMSRIKDNNSSQYAILMALAMADLCLLYSGLLTMWLFGTRVNVYVPGFHTVLCKLYSWSLYASNTTSAWLVTTVTVQRTMAVLWPHRMRMMCTVRRTWVVIAVVVITAWSVHFHTVIGYEIKRERCNAQGKYSIFAYRIWVWVDMVLSSSVPAICLFVCSIILSWTLFKSASFSSTAVRATSNVNTGQSHDGRKSDAVRATVMVLALSCTFLILTLPVCILVLWREFGFVYNRKNEGLKWLFGYLTLLMWYSNSAVNFLLYCITGARFRKEFLRLLRCGRKGHTVGETTAVTSSGGGSKR